MAWRWMGLGLAFVVACGGDTAVRTATDSTETFGTAPDTFGIDDSAPEETAGPTDTTPADTIAADTSPADTTAADTTAADTIPADTTAADTTAADTSPADITVEVAEVASDSVADGDAAAPVDATWPADRPHGQCASGADCPGMLVCADTAPGGICNGCGTEACPDGTSCNQFGACSRDCTSEADCPAGMRCNTAYEICALASCGVSGDCTYPYACDGGYCRRPSCAADPCPAPFMCKGDVCVEPYFAP